MAVFPAICDRCGALFPVPNPFDGFAHITMVGNAAGPCPVCGGYGHIPDGV